jgi:type II secretory pathway pseudopilin PulG
MRTPSRSSGFGLLEMILTFILVAGAAAYVFNLYQSAHTKAVAEAEFSFVQTLSANAQSTYPSRNYAGMNTWYVNAYLAKAPWTQSPSGLDWNLKSFSGSGDCTDTRCPTYWISTDYRDNPDFPEDVCFALLPRLSSEFYINTAPPANGARPTFRSAASLKDICTKGTSGVTPMTIYLVRPTG